MKNTTCFSCQENYNPELLRSIVKNLSCVMYRANNKDRVLFFDFTCRQIKNLTGYSIEEFSSGLVKWTSLIHQDDQYRVICAYSTILKNSNGPIQEYRIIDRNNKIVWVRDYQRLIDGEEGKIDGVIIDITQTKELELEHSRLIDELNEKNIALKNVIAGVAEEKALIKENIAYNIEKNILPTLYEIKNGKKASEQKIDMLLENLNNVTSDFYKKMTKVKFNLTPAEVKICQLLLADHRGKEIAQIQNISYLTVKTHKRNIRRKLKIKHKTNLRSYLADML